MNYSIVYMNKQLGQSDYRLIEITIKQMEFLEIHMHCLRNIFIIPIVSNFVFVFLS